MRPAIFACVFLVSSSIALADSIQLKDGRSIEGDIIESNALHVVIRDERGMMQRFYKEQVVNIMEDDAQAPLTIDPAQFEDITPQKVSLIIQLLEANGTQASLKRNVERTIEEAPPSRKEELESLFDMNEMTAELVPVYDRFFTMDELVALVDFYESPVGQKLIEVSSDLVNETAQATIGYFQNKLTRGQ